MQLHPHRRHSTDVLSCLFASCTCLGSAWLHAAMGPGSDASLHPVCVLLVSSRKSTRICLWESRFLSSLCIPHGCLHLCMPPSCFCYTLHHLWAVAKAASVLIALQQHTCMPGPLIDCCLGLLGCVGGILIVTTMPCAVCACKVYTCQHRSTLVRHSRSSSNGSACRG